MYAVLPDQTPVVDILQLYDYINSELIHNITFAHRLPPTLKEQAQALANYHEAGIFADAEPNGIANSQYSIYVD